MTDSTSAESGSADFLNGTAKRVAEQWVDSQRQNAQLMTSLATMWKDAFQDGADIESWKDRVASWGEKASEGSSASVASFENMTHTFLEGLGKLFSLPFGSGTPPWQTMSDNLSMPGLGLFREQQQHVQLATKSWMEGQKLQGEYFRLTMAGFTRAYQQFAQRVGERWSRGEAFSTPKEVSEIWVSAADEVFTEMFASEEFARAQNEMLNAQHQAKGRSNKLMEAWLKVQGLPTRTELEQAHKAIYELRKEVRSLKRALEERAP